MPNINHLKPFNYKYYKYINPKSLLINKHINKLIILGKLNVFIRYFKEIIKQVKIYILDLKYTTKVVRVDFKGEILNKTINFIIKRIKP
jgi:hypothetical protein